MSFSLSSVLALFASGLREALDWPLLSWLRSREPVAVTGSDGTQFWVRGHSVLAKHAKGKARCQALVLPPEKVLVFDLSLPDLPEAELEKALQLEVERASPFSAEQTVWGWALLARSGSAVAVRLALASRASVEEHRESLGALSGWRVDEVWAAHEPPVVLRGFGETARAHRERRYTAIALALLLAVLAGGLVLLLLPFMQLRATVFDAQSRYAVLEQQTAEIRANREQLLKLHAIGSALEQSYGAQADLVGAIEALAEALPDSVFVVTFEQRGNVVRFTGQGPAASTVVDRLGAVSAFENFRSTSAITRIDEEGNERFSVEFSFVSPGAQRGSGA